MISASGKQQPELHILAMITLSSIGFTRYVCAEIMALVSSMKSAAQIRRIR